MGDNPQVIISRAERLKIPRVLNSGRLAKLKVFRTRITDWAEPSPEVVEEPIIVCVKEKRKRTVDEREIEWYDEICKDHFHPDVMRFQDLIEHKKAAGYTVSVRDAVLAYVLVFGWARKSVIAGFLSSKYADGTPSFPEWTDVKVETIGEALSRLAKEDFITAVRRPKE